MGFCGWFAEVRIGFGVIAYAIRREFRVGAVENGDKSGAARRIELCAARPPDGRPYRTLRGLPGRPRISAGDPAPVEKREYPG